LIDVQLVVVNYHTYGLLQKFIDSYIEFTPSCSSALMVVDVESTDEMEKVRTYDTEVVREYSNIGYARACNWAGYLTTGRSRNLAFFNADTAFNNPYCIDECVEYLDLHDDIGVVGPLQYSTNGKVTSGGVFGTFDNPKDRNFHSQNIDACRNDERAVYVSGSAFFTKRVLWDSLSECPPFRETYPRAIGGFPTVPHFHEESSYCYHAHQHGYDTVFKGTSEMIHLWHQSSLPGSQGEKERIGRESFLQFRSRHDQWMGV